MQLWGQSLLMLPEATGCFDSDTLAQAAQLSSVRPQLVPLQWLTADLPFLRRATWRPFLPLLCCRGRPSPSSAWLTFVSTAELGATGNSWMKHGLCFPLHWWISFLVRYDGASDHVMFFFFLLSAPPSARVSSVWSWHVLPVPVWILFVTPASSHIPKTWLVDRAPLLTSGVNVRLNGCAPALSRERNWERLQPPNDPSVG